MDALAGGKTGTEVGKIAPGRAGLDRSDFTPKTPDNQKNAPF
jgi:hypothetical protein